MREHLSLIIHLLFTLAKLCKPGGVKAVMAENIAMRQQLITLSRARKRAPKLSAFDRFFFGLMACFVSKSRLQKIAVILKPATFLNFHKVLVKRKCLPKYLSTDNDPLFLFHRWQANLRILEVDEIKSIPGVPTSHPFVERLIGTCRRECVDRSLFWNARGLQRKLVGFQKYYNEIRVHTSLAMTTPNSKADECNISKNVVSLHDYRWRSHASELYHLPIAA